MAARERSDSDTRHSRKPSDGSRVTALRSVDNSSPTSSDDEVDSLATPRSGTPTGYSGSTSGAGGAASTSSLPRASAVADPRIPAQLLAGRTPVSSTESKSGGGGGGAGPPGAAPRLSHTSSTGSTGSTAATPADSSAASRATSLQPRDFLFGRLLGEGAYARVRLKRTGADYAVKILDQKFINKEKKVLFVMTEKRILSSLSHPNIVKLVYAFKDHRYLYMVMELCQNDLLEVVRHFTATSKAAGLENRALNMEQTRYYIANIVRALEYLHVDKRVIHRDLKPENILIDSAGLLKITDFGTAKDPDASESQKIAFCGTAEYVSPEVLTDQEPTGAVDLWALGCIVFQLLVGWPPFRGASEYLTFQQILGYPDSHSIEFPDWLPAVAKDLICSLLMVDPMKRLGADQSSSTLSYQALKNHPFFNGDFDACANGPPPFVPPPEADGQFLDGANEDWDAIGEATLLKSVVREMSVREVVADAEAKTHEPPRQLQAYWSRHLIGDERVVYSGLVQKRVGLFSKTRQLLLTDKPRLIYFDPETQEFKGEIPWGPFLKVVIKDKAHKIFDIHTPNRVYHLEELLNSADDWKANIEKVLASR